jgi:hypothetical protein
MPKSEKTREELVEEAKKTHEAVFDMENRQPVKHNWIDRGLNMTCEDAGHPYHVVFKKRRKL